MNYVVRPALERAEVRTGADGLVTGIDTYPVLIMSCNQCDDWAFRYTSIDLADLAAHAANHEAIHATKEAQ